MSAFLSYLSDKSWLGIEMALYVYFVSLLNLKNKMNLKDFFFFHALYRPGNDHPWKWQFYDYLESPVIKRLKFEFGLLVSLELLVQLLVCFSNLLLLFLFWVF